MKIYYIQVDENLSYILIAKSYHLSHLEKGRQEEGVRKNGWPGSCCGFFKIFVKLLKTNSNIKKSDNRALAGRGLKKIIFTKNIDDLAPAGGGFEKKELFRLSLNPIASQSFGW